MAGRNAYRDGRIVEAVQHYKAALEQDSTFAYAALGYLEATLWPSAALEFNPARKWMHSLRDRLTPRDRTYMRALAGPDYPAASTSAETDEAIAEARFALPYRPEVRFLDADRKFHGDAGSSLDEAAAGLRRALELDPGFSVALHHLFLLALLRGDVSEAGRLAEQYERTFPRADHVRSMNWALAMARGDEGAVAEFWDDPTDLTQSELTDVFLWTYAFGFPLSEAQRVLAEAWRRGDAPPDFLRFYEYFTELNAGHPAVAARVRPNADPIVAALYSVGDSSSAADHARDLASRQDAPVAGDKWELSEQAHGTCVLEQWWLWQGRRSETLERSIERILEAERRAPQVEGRQNLHTCALLLRALEAVLWDTPDAETALARADSAFREGPGGPQAPYARLLLAKLFMRLGKAESALRNLRYRCRFCPGSVFFLADVLREEGRLAAVLGDHEGAVEAYQRYLALRGDPEPSVQPQVDSVRLELRNLLVRTRSPAAIRAADAISR
jgi:tetratricopeptide (TPR) repeat protein